jgi:hypothetical protein
MNLHNSTCHQYSLPSWLIYTLVILAFVCGCAHLVSKDPEQILHERITKVWKAKVEGDCATIYALACSNYRKNITKDQHMLRSCKGNFDDFRIVDVELKTDGTTARVTIQFDTESHGFLIKGAQIKETWIKENGQWVVDLPVKPKSPFGF